MAANRSRRNRGRGRSAGARVRNRGAGGPAAPSPLAWLGLFAAYVVVALVVYAPALGGPFISDDLHYVRDNPYVHELSFESLRQMFDPSSVLTVIVENYAPLHLLLHNLEWQIFGSSVAGYHVVNLLLHALASVLLVRLFMRHGIGLAAAACGGLLFLAHPANVEPVAWISQLKSSAALVLTLCAVLAHPRRPALAALAFAAGLLVKPFTAVALVVVALQGWLVSRRRNVTEGEEAKTDWRWGWLGAWLAVVVVFAVLESRAFSQTAAQAHVLYGAPLVRVRMIFYAAFRYVVMTLSGTGLSTFHEPDPIASFFDPRLAVAYGVLASMAWRLVVVLRRGADEALFWTWALVSFAPLSGVVPLPFPIADRYLYFILPGFIGAGLLAGREVLERVDAAWPALAGGRGRRACLAAGLLVAGVFGVMSNARARIWTSPTLVTMDAERNYPNGTAAQTRIAARAVRDGDFAGCVEALRRAYARGYNRLDHLLADPYGPIQGYPPFVELEHEMAREWIDRLSKNPDPSQLELIPLAQAYYVIGDLDRAIATIDRGLAIPGPKTADLERFKGELERLQRLRRKARQ